MDLKIKEFKELLRNKYFWMGLAILVSGIILNQLSSRFLYNKFGNNGLPILSDLILDNIPCFNIVWLYDLLAIIPLALFFIYAWRKDVQKTPYFLLLFGISQWLRGIFIILTPFGSPKIFYNGLFNSTAFRMGVYPSGHTGSSFLAFLLSKGTYKYIILVASILIMIALLFGRGHYSIDILSAILFNYAIYCFGEKYLKRKLEQKFKKHNFK